jgi:uncharacterized membrane protein YsdA (DUF1294 family)
VRFHALTAATLTLAGALLLWWGLSRRLEVFPLLACWLVAVNVVAFGYYGYDKSRARSAPERPEGGAPAWGARVPEVVLHGLTAAGGAAGAYAGMELFRHKTVKGRFRVVFWCVVALQLALIAWVVKRTWWG